MLGVLDTSALPDAVRAKINITPDGCWIWKGRLTKSGYARFGATAIVHRLAYEKIVGPIPTGLVLDHVCRVRACVNPAHLEPVTDAENILRGTGFAARNARKTFCDRGHLLTEAYVFTKKGDRRKGRASTERNCRECNRLAAERYRARLKAGGSP